MILLLTQHKTYQGSNKILMVIIVEPKHKYNSDMT